MLDAAWCLFLLASIVVITRPGQDMILVMSRSVPQGPAAGVSEPHPTLTSFLLVLLGLGLKPALERRE